MTGLAHLVRKCLPRIGPTAVACVMASVAWAAPTEPQASIVARWIVPAVPQPAGGQTVPLGGISDLFPAGADSAALRGVGGVGGPSGSFAVWAVTDRGPNGVVKVNGRKRRTLPAPAFSPCIVELACDLPQHEDSDRVPGAARVGRVLPLRGRSRVPLSGLPNGVAPDEPIYDAAGREPLASDPNGVDTEGVVALADGSFWLCEEYRPSLLAVDAAGAVRSRFVPAGVAVPGADMEVLDCLPPAYARRRDNRGFEALAVSADGERLYALLQSPLESPVGFESRGNVRLLVFDTIGRRPLAEHVYRLGDSDSTASKPKGGSSEDGKLCAMAMRGDDTLVVLEQAGDAVCRLYEASLRRATDTLARAADAEPLEALADLDAVGIVPLEKRLLADLAPLRDTFAADVHGRDSSRDAPAVKLEGLVLVDDRHVLLVNDNDFAIDTAADADPAATCLWLVRLPRPLGP